MFEHRVEFSELVGKTIEWVKVGTDIDNSTTVLFLCKDGSTYSMYHEQDCCETVTLEEIAGDWRDITGSSVVKAEEVTEENPKIEEEYDGYGLWTFYKIETPRGSVTLRWYGESNGFYSVAVPLRVVTAQSALWLLRKTANWEEFSQYNHRKYKLQRIDE